MQPSCLICESPVNAQSNIPFAYCDKCKKLQQVVYIETPKAESIFYDSYMINLYVEVKTGLCSLLTSDGTYKFPLGKRYDGYALEQMLYAASADFNADYVSQEHVQALVQQAISGIHHQMRAYRIRKIKVPKKKRAKPKSEKVSVVA